MLFVSYERGPPAGLYTTTTTGRLQYTWLKIKDFNQVYCLKSKKEMWR
jgi:hypothetical protein